MGLELEDIILQQGAFRLTASFPVATGARVAIIGPSGAGKSTLLAAIAGFLMPVTGVIRWGSDDLSACDPGARPLSILFQDNNLFPHLTVFQNVALGLRPNLRLSPAERAEVMAALDRVGLTGLGDRRPAQLSGGQQSRVALARVLLRRRPLLLLDEPFSALGPALKSEMLDLVGRIAAEQRLTLLMVTHDPADARRLCDQTVLVADGIALPPMATEKIFADPPPALRAYLGQGG
ncbi:ATP-binding cassette domain-containing protein [Halodurantibacterium flavum]|uniref:ATP-binding cassette domain-containing protein n=1 Tax=Halodurantibacterium flavum TaxID=1382802 RepID=A0ABW4S6J3_9RHOB